MGGRILLTCISVASEVGAMNRDLWDCLDAVANQNLKNGELYEGNNLDSIPFISKN